MLTPRYELSAKLLLNIAAIERLYGQIEAIPLPQKLGLNLGQQNLIQSTYASNKIEGNQLSFREVTNLLLNERVPVSRDEKEVRRYFDLLRQLDKYANQEVGLDLVIKIHERLFSGMQTYAGQIRNEIVAVGKYLGEKGNVSFKVKHLPPFHAKVEIEQALRELSDWIRKKADLPIVVRAGIFHHQFLYLHPFEDGNGRVCRVLTALLFIKEKYRINRLFVLDDYYDLDRTAYSDALHSADGKDETKWLEYFAEGVKVSLQSALARTKEAWLSLAMAERPTSKERVVLGLIRQQPEMTSGEIASELQVSRQQAHNLLAGLVKKGLVEKLGATKSSYYRIK